ncbi:uncharacterized protein LOC128209841 [Mya arenaria]|uniref:uncharacterized protein LOC128209841 n=1 Tax=Mya arenaria TaxID=6604 RepID=UPI0022DF5E4F|nr:uncharacterized protein LOC128209841 [Mya arenaria]
MRLQPKSEISIMLLALLLQAVHVSGEICVSPTVPSNLCECRLENGVRRLNCQDKRLTDIPTFTPTNDIFDEIDFTYYIQESTASNKISNIPDYAFENITTKKVNLLTNPVSSVSFNAFNSVSSKTYLEELLIEGNLTNLPPTDPLGTLTNLKYLHLKSYQKFVLIGADFPFPNLVTLILDTFIGLTTVNPAAFAPLQNVEELHLENMPSMTTLPIQAWNQLPKIKDLRLKNLAVSTIEAQTFHSLQNLEFLYIHYISTLKTIQNGAFGAASSTLTHLYLKYDDLSDLGFLASETFPNLTHLDLSYNTKLYNGLISPNFTTLTALRTMNLGDVGLSSVGKTMLSGLGLLHTLDLSYNNIQTVENQAFSLMPNLVELRMSKQTRVINFAQDAFQGIESSLEHLLLDLNRISYTQFWPLLETLTNLVELNLEGTGLTEIRDYTFQNNQKLSNLHIKSNSISSINQKTFFGPRNTLRVLDLSLNRLTTISACLFSDFQPKPTFYFTGNPLNCTCDLTWLFDWVLTHPTRQQQIDAALAYVGTCGSPANLAGKYMLDDFQKVDMCPTGGGTIPQCPDLYATTTPIPTTTTSASTIVSTTPPLAPIPDFELLVVLASENFIELTWTVSDKTDVTGYQINMTANYINDPVIKNIVKEDKNVRFYELKSGEYFYFCLALRINSQLRTETKKCASANTLLVQTTTTEAVTQTPEANIGLIAGLSAGGAILIILIIVIVYLLLKSNKQKKAPPSTSPMTFTMHPHANVPQAGGTAKRFAKKPDKEGATPDDINITMISNGDMNKGRISAGSYQELHTKGLDNNPMPSSSKNGAYAIGPDHRGGAYPSSPSSPDHYTNSFDQRPLPQAPGGRRGYVNTGYKKSNEHLPETSKNEYSEARY